MLVSSVLRLSQKHRVCAAPSVAPTSAICQAPPRQACRRSSRTALAANPSATSRSEEHTSELQSHHDLVCCLLLEKTKSPSSPTSPKNGPLPKPSPGSPRSSA